MAQRSTRAESLLDHLTSPLRARGCHGRLCEPLGKWPGSAWASAAATNARSYSPPGRLRRIHQIQIDGRNPKQRNDGGFLGIRYYSIIVGRARDALPIPSDVAHDSGMIVARDSEIIPPTIPR
jgi:hypothetical protein